ncbi:tagatose-6-phosphate kinase [Virgibacillus profundi]|uniref:Tagatose-6-phosphate kinase n=1 Tax=Virgibacillus profundi TaxID=2024555 RepID=A0A2A2IHN2_9BACI|nr:hexose kinase [Virgibacillus profundi]PAV31137.1 tagatose-6-phosphate kinase [Virgibacillus profundi]PXY55320.1 tagatose-6-phosphate kinase [Virgibacillus profundi]
MILTITLNPSVDISYKSDSFNQDTVNRIADVSKTAGGKGLNVSRVLKQLEAEVGAAGFLGGNLGDFIRSEISLLGIYDFFTEIQGETRNCIAVIHDEKQTEILEGGPVIAKKEAELFLEKLPENLQQANVVTISGSLPKGLANDFYEKIIGIANRNGTPVLLDTKGELLAQALGSGNSPYLIKPNQEELADLLGEKLTTERQIVEALNSILFADIPWVVVTLGKNGALVKHNNAVYRATAPKIDAVNPVGSGDSVIAGFAAGIARHLAGEELIKYGLSMGVLNAMQAKTGQIDPEKVDWCVRQIQVERILK